MASKDLIMNLAKLLVAMAWVDGRLQASEINTLKDLIYSWGEIEEDDWTELDAYMDSPVGDAEREQLLAQVVDSIRTGSDKKLVTQAVREVVSSDGVVTEDEEAALESVRQAVESSSTGLGSLLGTLMGGRVRRRPPTPPSAASREERLHDFVQNEIYFQLVNEIHERGLEAPLPDEEMKTVCLSAGLLAQVAWIDQSIDDGERSAIGAALARRSNLPPEIAELVSDIAVARTVSGLDRFRLSRSFFERTSHDERAGFLRTLFEVANATNKTSFDEIEEIRRISKSLKLPHDDFIKAKLSIAPEDRGGL